MLDDRVAMERSPLDVEGVAPRGKDVPPVYDGQCRLLFWKHDPRVGMTVDLILYVPGPLGGHPFREMRANKEVGQRMRLLCQRHDEVGEVATIYAGEALLLEWKEDSRNGMWTRLEIDDGPDGEMGRHPFYPYRIGRAQGEPMHLSAVAIDEDERRLAPSRIKRRTPFRDMDAVKQVHILCQDARFRSFLRVNLNRFVKEGAARDGLVGLDDKPTGFPLAVVRSALGVSSCAVMNHLSEAGYRAKRRWNRMMEIYRDEAHHHDYVPMAEADPRGDR